MFLFKMCESVMKKTKNTKKRYKKPKNAKKTYKSLRKSKKIKKYNHRSSVPICSYPSVFKMCLIV